MAVPDYYDDQAITIRVDPNTMFHMATIEIPVYGGEVADSINRIVDIWNGLKLGWVGNTATEAQEFNDLWTQSITQIFGTGDGSTGILSRLANGIAIAAVNYGETEDVVASMLNQMTTALQDTGGSNNSSGDRSVNGGPITENN
jgi:hypothetical protein